MKKLTAILLTALLILSLVACSQNNAGENETTSDTGSDMNVNDGTTTQYYSAIPVPPANNQLTVIDSYTDGEVNYYLLDAGYIKNVYFSTLAELNYTGVPASSSKTTYSSTSVSTALSTTVVESYTHSNSHSTHVGAGFEEKVDAKFPFVGGGELTFSQELGWDWSGEDTVSGEKSVSNTNETAKTYAEEQTVGFNFGWNEGPSGHYRYAMYGTCDVYYVVTTSADNQTLLSCSISTCARPSSFFVSSEYSADGNFDNSPESEISFAEDFYKSLPIPTAQKPESDVGGGNTSGDVGGSTSPYAGGSGTQTDPYLISNDTQFKYMVNNCSSGEYYKLMSNISLGDWSTLGILNWNKNSRTAPKYFTGHLDGNGMQVSYKVRIGVTTPMSYALGLFPAAKDAEIRNLKVAADLSTYDPQGRNQKWHISNNDRAEDVMVGGIIGYASNVKLSNCSVSGNICFNSDGGDGDTCVAGVVGYALNCPSIVDCSSSATVYARGYWVRVGGVIAVCYGSTTYGNLSFSGQVSFNEDWAFGGGHTINELVAEKNKEILNLN